MGCNTIVSTALILSTIFAVIYPGSGDTSEKPRSNTKPSVERWCMLKPADVMLLRAQTNRPVPLVCDAPSHQSNASANSETVTFLEFVSRQLLCLRRRSARSIHGACTMLRDLPTGVQARFVFLIPLCLVSLSASMCIVCSQLAALKEANHRLSGAIGKF